MHHTTHCNMQQEFTDSKHDSNENSSQTSSLNLDLRYHFSYCLIPNTDTYQTNAN